MFFLPQQIQKLHDLFLHGDIQCRRRLITDQNLRLDRQCSCNRCTLALTAAYLMRISFCKLFRKTALLQQLPYPLLCFFPGNSGISETFPDPFPQRPARVERADRILI